MKKIIADLLLSLLTGIFLWKISGAGQLNIFDTSLNKLSGRNEDAYRNTYGFIFNTLKKIKPSGVLGFETDIADRGLQLEKYYSTQYWAAPYIIAEGNKFEFIVGYYENTSASANPDYSLIESKPPVYLYKNLKFKSENND